MRKIVLNRQLLGLEDLLFGVGIVTQTRAGQSVDITRINASNMPFDETQTLLEWAQSVNLENLGNIVDELQAIYDNLTVIGNVEDSLLGINTLEDNLLAIQSLYTNISKLQNIDTNMSKLQNIDTNMSKLQNLDTNMSKLQAIYVDLAKLGSLYANLTILTSVYNNLTALNNINSQVIPNLTELLLVNDNAVQVAADKLTVAADKGIVAGYKSDVTSMKLAVESIYDAFDDRFLGTKTIDPTVDNDGNTLLDGAMYFNTSSNALKVYSLDNTTWYTIPQIYLSGLLDVQLTSITTGDILTWNGTKWINTRTPSFNSIKLNGGTGTAGTSTWNNTELTYDLVLNDNVTLQVGQEEVVYCKNSTLTTIPNGKPVMAVGTNGNSGNILIDLHDGTKASAKRIIGLTTQSILPSTNANPYGFVTRNGKVRGLNTTGSDYGETWVDGDILYVKATGALTKVEPLDTTLKMPIAFVIHAHTNGTLYVRTTGIDENHDRDLIDTKVAKVTSTDNAIVRFNGMTGNVQNSGVVIDDSNNIVTAGSITAGSGNVILTYGSANAQILGLNTDVIYGTTGANSIKFFTTGTQKLVIDAAGNGGWGVTPSAWTETHKALQFPGGGSLYNNGQTNGYINLASNNYYDGSNWRYINSTGASNYIQGNGNHYWNIASSGTAGSPITWNTAMTLDASGKLSVMADNSEFRIGYVNSTDRNLNIRSNPGYNSSLTFTETGISDRWTIGAMSGNGSLFFKTGSSLANGTTAMTLGSNGNLLVGTTTDNGVDKLQVNGSISSGAVAYKGTTDLNTYKTLTQNFRCDAGSSNAPELDYGIVEVIVYEANAWVLQRFTSIGANTPSSENTTWQRMYVGAAQWTAWKQITN